MYGPWDARGDGVGDGVAVGETVGDDVGVVGVALSVTVGDGESVGDNVAVGLRVGVVVGVSPLARTPMVPVSMSVEPSRPMTRRVTLWMSEWLNVWRATTPVSS